MGWLSTQVASEHHLSRLELLTLVGFLFFLPLQEAPKNLLWLLFIMLWLGRAVFARAGFGGAWQHRSDLPFALMLLAAALACLLAPPLPQNWGEFGDVLRYSLFGWLLSRSCIADRQLRLILGALLIGTLVAAIQGWWYWKITGAKSFFELHSVGHTNHSAIYLMIVTLGATGTLLVMWPRLTRALRIALLFAWLWMSWLMATGESRGAMLAYVAGLFILLWVFIPRQWRIWSFMAVIFVLSAMLAASPYLIDKTLSQFSDPTDKTKSSKRIELARTATQAIKQRPLSGIGPGNFRLADAEQVQNWLAASGEAYHPERYFHSSHAHNIYFNTLAERGVLGGAALVFLAVIWLRELLRLAHRTFQNSPDRLRVRWVLAIAMSGFVGVFVAGIFNTSLHHEHGLLAMLTLGLLLAETRNASPCAKGNPHLRSC